MATMRQPTTRDIEALLSFLPKLYAEGFTPIRRVHNVDQDGETVAFPWAEYDDIVRDFVDAARRECWLDYDYVPEEVERLIESEEAIAAATLPQLQAMLTYFVRGERFCDGHWGRLIEGGHVRRILERLAELEQKL